LTCGALGRKRFEGFDSASAALADAGLGGCAGLGMRSAFGLVREHLMIGRSFAGIPRASDLVSALAVPLLDLPAQGFDFVESVAFGLWPSRPCRMSGKPDTLLLDFVELVAFGLRPGRPSSEPAKIIVVGH
jgi:hypothetical protein